MTSDDDRWNELRAVMMYHTCETIGCDCVFCNLVRGEDPEFQVVVSDAESLRLRQLFAAVSAAQKEEKDVSMKNARGTNQHTEATFSLRVLPGCSRKDNFLLNVDDRVLDILVEASVLELDGYGPIKPHDNIGRLAYAIWARTRAIEYAPLKKIEDALSAKAGVGSPFRVIEDICRALAAAGDLEQTLTREKRRIDSTLEFLAARRRTVGV